MKKVPKILAHLWYNISHEKYQRLDEAEKWEKNSVKINKKKSSKIVKAAYESVTVTVTWDFFGSTVTLMTLIFTSKWNKKNPGTSNNCHNLIVNLRWKRHFESEKKNDS